MGRSYGRRKRFEFLNIAPPTQPTVELVLQRTHPEDRASVQATLDQAAADRKAFDFEHRMLMTDGSVKYVRVVGHPSTNDESGNFEFVGAVTDITDRKRAEEALRRSEGYLAQAQRLTQSGSWAWNLHTGARFWSQETFASLAAIRKKGNLHGRDILTGFTRKIETAILRKRESGDHREGGFEVHFRIVLPDGTIKHLSLDRSSCGERVRRHRRDSSVS